MNLRTIPRIVLVVACLSAQIHNVVGQSRDPAEAIALDFLHGIENGKAQDAYRSDVGQFFKQRVTEAAFVSQMVIMINQLGGPASTRELVYQRDFDFDPMSGARGTFRAYRYKSAYPMTNVYEDVTVIKEPSGWKVGGIFFNPADVINRSPSGDTR
jgi:hypothetical protein